MNAVLQAPVSVMSFVGRYANRGVFVAMQFAWIMIFFVPVSLFDVCLCIGFYFLRIFAIGACFHRYLAHRSYNAPRWFVFILAVIASCAVQRGPIRWARDHRQHHRKGKTDKEGDPHSPVHPYGNPWHGHIGWVLEVDNNDDQPNVDDLTECWELRVLDRWHFVPPVLLACLCWFLNEWSGVAWGFFFSTFLLYQITFCVNSVCHLFGSRRFNTPDESRNNWWVALLTMGEGWHNNHHHQPGSESQGIRWYELDMTHLTLKFFSWFRLVQLRK